MAGAAPYLAQQYRQRPHPPDLIVASDMLDVAAFKGLIAGRGVVPPIVLYFHENQLTYPWSPDDPDPGLNRDHHYAFTNLTSALAADAVWFNSEYHQRSFLNALPAFLRQFPDHRPAWAAAEIAAKSHVQPLALDLSRFDRFAPTASLADGPPLILWNHRWEYDKAPERFFEILQRCQSAGLDFRLVLLGERYGKVPPIFEQARQQFEKELLHWGYADTFEAYARWLWRADIALTTAVQDFFGGSVVEAIYCKCYPLLPDRLAYPEHIPEAHREDFLYTDDRQAVQKLIQLLSSPQTLPVPGALRSRVSRYDWFVQVNRYDEAVTTWAQRP